MVVLYKAARENGNERHLDLVTILLGDFRQDFYTGGEKIDCIILDGKIYDIYCGHKKYEGSYYFDPKYNYDLYHNPLFLENWRNLHNYSAGLSFLGKDLIKGSRGHGIFYYRDGKIQYNGEWANDKKHGYGTEYVFTTQGDRFEEHAYRGEWIDDEKEGFGRLFINDFLVYEGYWHENTFNGYGELYYTDEDYRGLKFKGIFDSGYPWEGTLYDNKYNIVYNGRFEYRYDILRYDGTDDYKKTIVYENNPDIYNMDDDMGEFDY